MKDAYQKSKVVIEARRLPPPLPDFLYAPDFMEIHEAYLHIVDGRAYSKKVSAVGSPKGGASEACGLFEVSRILHFSRNSREGGKVIKRCLETYFFGFYRKDDEKIIESKGIVLKLGFYCRINLYGQLKNVTSLCCGELTIMWVIIYNDVRYLQ